MKFLTRLLKKKRAPHFIFAFTFVLATGCIKSSVNGTLPLRGIETDYYNNRILIWTSGVNTSQGAPSVVLGQPDFYSGTANNGGISAQTLDGPSPFCTDGNAFFVPDQLNSRILGWTTFPTKSQQPADIVLGQPNMYSGTANTGLASPTAQTLNAPNWCSIANGRLYVADSVNQRVLIWNSLPTTTQQPADIVLGQASMFLAVPGTSSQQFTNTKSAYVDGTHLFVADGNNCRVLIWNTLPTVSQQPADVVLGQSSMSSTALCGTAQSLSAPTGILVIGNRLFIADRSNNRVLIWNSIPTVNLQSADLVLGEPNMTTVSINAGLGAGTATAQTMNHPASFAFDGQRLFITDANNSRILGYNSLPTTNFQAADFALGQVNFFSVSANQGSSVGPLTLSTPLGIFFNDNILGVWRPSGY